MRKKLIKIIFGKLYMNLAKVEIIEHNDTIWFIDVDEKYWYLRYQKLDGVLWWRHEFFSRFFPLFSMEQGEYEPIISEWAEEVLNYKVSIPSACWLRFRGKVEEVLNYKVKSIKKSSIVSSQIMEDALNYKLMTIETIS